MVKDIKLKRKNTRFVSDPKTIVELSLSPQTKGFKGEYTAIALTESFKGCSVVLAAAPTLVVGNKVCVKLGELAPLVAEVRWVILFDDQVQKVGFLYLD